LKEQGDPRTAPGLEIQDVSKRFGGAEILRQVSLSAPPGGITALIGQNGAGKSTLFRIIMGLVRPDSGRAFMDGRDILSLPLHLKAGAGLGYLPQECASFDELTAEQNLLALLEVMPLDKIERQERLGRLLSLTGIEEVAGRRFKVLSGGEQRRLEIAKALAGSPRILLLDEPFSGIDPLVVEELINLFRKLASRGIGILVTDHNVHMTLKFADYVYLLAGRTILCQGTPEYITDNQEAKDIYLGQGFYL
jgi:lipopolysaccharide export system ATP-binding protein